MNILKKYIIFIELIGLFLVLGSIYWRVFIQEPIQTIAIGSEYYNINKKLDSLWSYIGEIDKKMFPIDETGRETSSYNELNYKWCKIQESNKSVKKQSETFSYISGIIFLIGTFIVSIMQYVKTSTLIDKMK